VVRQLFIEQIEYQNSHVVLSLFCIDTQVDCRPLQTTTMTAVAINNSAIPALKSLSRNSLVNSFPIPTPKDVQIEPETKFTSAQIVKIRMPAAQADVPGGRNNVAVVIALTHALGLTTWKNAASKKLRGLDTALAFATLAPTSLYAR